MKIIIILILLNSFGTYSQNSQQQNHHNGVVAVPTYDVISLEDKIAIEFLSYVQRWAKEYRDDYLNGRKRENIQSRVVNTVVEDKKSFEIEANKPMTADGTQFEKSKNHQVTVVDRNTNVLSAANNNICEFGCEDRVYKTIFETEIKVPTSLCGTPLPADNNYPKLDPPYSVENVKPFVGQLCANTYTGLNEAEFTNLANQAIIYGGLDESTCKLLEGDIKNADHIKNIKSRTYKYLSLICPMCTRYYVVQSAKIIRDISVPSIEVMNDNLNKLIDEQVEEYLKKDKTILIFMSFSDNIDEIYKMVKASTGFNAAKGTGNKEVKEPVIRCNIAKKLHSIISQYTTTPKASGWSIAILTILSIAIVVQIGYALWYYTTNV